MAETLGDRPSDTDVAEHPADHARPLEDRAQQDLTPEDQAMFAEQTLSPLYASAARWLSRSVRACFGDGPPDPDDVTQLAFQKLLERPKLSDVKDLKAYLWMTARNLVFKEKRALDVRARHDFEIEHIYFPLRGADSTPEGVFMAKQQLAIINVALRQMPPKRRRAFVLNRIDGMTLSAVARKLNISRNAAVKHVTRAVEDIDAALDATVPSGAANVSNFDMLDGQE
ncbi:MAG: sigma-70 family RNA polymerase sigma factor [Pseudomonadota bacterium]